MRKHHTYGATDNIVMDFRVKAEGKAISARGRSGRTAIHTHLR